MDALIFRTLVFFLIFLTFSSKSGNMENVRANAMDDLNDKKFIVTVEAYSPFTKVTFSDANKTKIASVEGFDADVLKLLSEYLNFTFEFIPSVDQEWGAKLPNGSFNGMIGMVQRKEVDLAIGGITITEERRKVVDFPDGIHEESNAFLLPPPTQEDNLFAFAKPFNGVVWFYYVFFSIMVSLAHYYFLIKMEMFKAAFLYPRPNTTDRSTRVQFILSSLTICTISLNQGVSHLRLTFSSRILLTFWMIGAFLLATEYSTMLISFLAVPRPKLLAETLQEVLDKNIDIETGISHSFLDYIKKFEPPSTFFYLRKYFDENPERLAKSQKSIQVFIDNINEKRLFINDVSYLLYVIEAVFNDSGLCLALSPERFYKGEFGIVVQKNAKYLKSFNQVLQKMREAGFMSFLHRKHMNRHIECLVKPKFGVDDAKILNLQDISGHFLLLGIGLLLSFVCFVIEIGNRYWLAP